MAAQESSGTDGLVSQWRRLQAEQLELRVELEQEQDPDRRAELIERVKAGREQLASFDASANVPATSRPPSLYSFDDLAAPAATADDQPPTSGTEADSSSQSEEDEIDDLLRMLTVDADSSGNEASTVSDGSSPADDDNAPVVRRGTPPLPDGPPRLQPNQMPSAGSNGQSSSPALATAASVAAAPGTAASAPAPAAPAPETPPQPDLNGRDNPVLLNATVTDGLIAKSSRGNSAAIAAVAGALGALLLIGASVLIWTIASNRSDSTGVDGESGAEAAVASATGGPAADAEELRSMLDVLGLDEIDVELDGSVIRLNGMVASEEEHDILIRTANALVEDTPLDATGLVIAEGSEESQRDGGESGAASVLTARELELQGDIDRITAVTPVIFDAQTSQLGELQLRVLAKIADVLLEYPEVEVNIIGFTDASGDPITNSELSEARAANVERFLISRGVEASRLSVVARGEEGSTGSAALAGLERRVDFEVVGSTSS